MEHPISLDRLPKKLQLICSPKQKVQLKLSAAKGIIPGAAPWEILTILYMLSYDKDSQISETSKQTLKRLPKDILFGGIDSPQLFEEVLDYLSDLFIEDEEVIEKIILSPKVADETIAKLASVVNERLVDIIATNQERLLRYPEIIEKIYMNKNAKQSTADRAIELAVREGIELKGIPAFKEIKAAILGEEIKEERDEVFEEALKIGESLESKTKEIMVEEGEEEKEEKDVREHRRKLSINISRLSVPQKIRLAILGNAFHRALLIRDPNKTVAMAAIKSPAVTDQEVIKYAQNKSLPEDIIRYIAEKREWTKNYQVKLALVNNPKCPITQALNFLSHLRPFDLKAIARSKNVPQAVAQAARNMLSRRAR